MIIFLSILKCNIKLQVIIFWNLIALSRLHIIIYRLALYRNKHDTCKCLYVDVVLCSWRTAVCESCWESAARRFWCWRGTTRLTAHLSRHCSPAQTSVWGRAKGRQRLLSLQTIIQSCPTNPTMLHYRVTCTHCATWMSISHSAWGVLQEGPVESVKHWDPIIFPSLHHHDFSLEKSNRLIQPSENNHFWNSKIGILWMITSPEHETL